MKFTDARAVAPHILFEEIDRKADARALEKLGAWLVRFSPRVALDGADAVVMETTGCDHLFGGETEMAAMLTRRLKLNGYSARIALASTPGAAWALAHYAASEAAAILPDGEEREGLKDLPVAALRLSEDAARLLRRFGLTRIGQLYGLDRKALARRFSSRAAADAVVLRLDQALGRRPEPLTPLFPEPDWSVSLNCPELIASTEGVQHALADLAPRLCAQLDAHGAGARDFVLSAFRADGGSSRIAVAAARPVRDPAHILRLFGERIDQIDPGLGVDLFMLDGFRAEGMAEGSAPLSAELAGEEHDPAALARLADRLAARLGEGAVRVSHFSDSHIPERAESLNAFDGDVTEPPNLAMQGARPLRLLEPPEHVEVLAQLPDGPPARFIWRRVPRRIARADGPERIAPEWWKLSEKNARARDYYRVEDDDGRRYWIYRDGLYDDNRGGPPQWYVHGLFA